MSSPFLESDFNPVAVKTAAIPVVAYDKFFTAVKEKLKDDRVHCLAYFTVPTPSHYQFFCALADDSAGTVLLLSHHLEKKENAQLHSLAKDLPAFHPFEREIHEQTGIGFPDHPWLKPIRYAANRSDRKSVMENYPFFTITGEMLHEVGVGPIHAGVIEPGYFRFICKGEKVLHLEIQLGYQHRGIETLFLQKRTGLQRMILAESIAGDTTIGHGLAHAMLMESLQGAGPDGLPDNDRLVALELERIALHIGDTAALCTDVAFQFGQVTCEALRTIVINTTQLWCGNRFGKGLIRVGGSHFPVTAGLRASILKNLNNVDERFQAIVRNLYNQPSVLSRFETTGVLTRAQATGIGAVGMAARSSGLLRDVRFSHPFGAFRKIKPEPVILDSGDVYARALLRAREVDQSLQIIRSQLRSDLPPAQKPAGTETMLPGMFVLSITEGWRGEIVHAALTDDQGHLTACKVKDPSFHNWMALALAVRNQEISDFPLCNKSFNLSYCGHDL